VPLSHDGAVQHRPAEDVVAVAAKALGRADASVLIVRGAAR
jgi:hypothetical protein